MIRLLAILSATALSCSALNMHAAVPIVAFDGSFESVPFVATEQNNIWSGVGVGGVGIGLDITNAVNGFTAQGNDPGALPLGGDPVLGTAFIDFAAGPGSDLNARGTVYAFEAPAGIYQLEYRASWGSSQQSVLDAYLYDRSVTPTFSHRFDWNTGNAATLYGDLSGVNPANSENIEGITLLFDNGVMSGAQTLSVTSDPFTVAPTELVVFRMAGLGFGTDSSGARLDLLRLNPVAPALLAGDYNNDGEVTAADYTIWRDALNSSQTLPNDLTPGEVSADDYDVWAANYGRSEPPAATATPEPGCCLTTLITVMVVCLNRPSHRSIGR